MGKFSLDPTPTWRTDREEVVHREGELDLGGVGRRIGREERI